LSAELSVDPLWDFVVELCVCAEELELFECDAARAAPAPPPMTARAVAAATSLLSLVPMIDSFRVAYEDTTIRGPATPKTAVRTACENAEPELRVGEA
jgi:hypothetical protein